MAINILRVGTLDLWRWLEHSSHPAMHGIEWLNVRSNGCRVLGQCNAVACCGAQLVIDVGGRPGEANRGSDISAIHKTHHRQGTTGTGPATPHSGRIMWFLKPNLCCFHWSAVIVSAWGSPIWYFCITLFTMWLLLLGTV
jgi:hypothetical protein